MARSTGSHCDGQAPPRTKGRGFQLDSPSELTSGRSTRCASARWSRNGGGLGDGGGGLGDGGGGEGGGGGGEGSGGEGDGGGGEGDGGGGGKGGDVGGEGGEGGGDGGGGGGKGEWGGGNSDGGGGEGSYESSEPAASQPPSHDASISSSAVRHTPRVRPWWAVRGRRRQAARQKLLAGLSWSVCRV